MSESSGRGADFAGSFLAGPWYRILAIPASARGNSAESDFVTVLPAVLSAAQRGVPFVVGWLSRGGGAALELVTNAGPLMLPDGAEIVTSAAAPAPPAAKRSPPQQTGMLFPNGARGVPIGDGWLADAGRLVWTPCPGRQAPPLTGGAAGQAAEEAGQPALFESTLVTLAGRPFGWLVIAEPTGLLEAEIAELRTELSAIRRFDAERARFDAERAERRMAELDAYREAGLWNVRVLAGAATPAELRRVAPVLVGSADLGRHPYRLSTGVEAHGLAEALTAKVQGRTDDLNVPFPATAGALAALAGLPRHEVPGLRVIETGYFDVTSETDARDTGSGAPESGTIELGAILDGHDRPVGTFRVPLTTLNRHAFITGATGAGKSQTVRHLLEGLTHAGLPWLAIEPAKSEYAAMAGRVEGISQVTVINPSDPRAIPISVNPLAPEPGYPVQAHIDMVRALFQAAFDAEEPFPQIMSQALQRVYEANGWDVVTGRGMPGALAAPAVPTLEQLQRTALQVIEDVGYGKELQADVRGFVDVRLRSLRIGSAGRFFEGGHPADIAELLRRNVVLAIEDVANDEDKAFLMGTLIIRIVEHLRLRARGERAGALRHVIVIEEAHRLLRNRGQERASSHAVELFAGMLAEIRAYGEGIVVAEQIPTKLVPDVVKNTALKVVHRLPAQDDRHLVGAAMNLDGDQSRQVVSLEPGIAAVFADGMDRPLRVRLPLGERRERVLEGPAPPIRGRRSPACGRQCRTSRACSLAEMRAAELMSGATEYSWLRIWSEALVLAFLTNNGLPAVPEPARRRWVGSDGNPRLRECVLASVIERAVAARALALRDSYEPQRLMQKAAETASRILDGAAGLAGAKAGPTWVIPQVRWLFEADQAVTAAGRSGVAPALSFDLPGVTDGPGVPAQQRLYELRTHPLSLELEHNRQPAWDTLLGDDDHASFARDLATVMIGADPGAYLSEAADVMCVAAAQEGEPGWLERVLSWPSRFIGAYDEGKDPLDVGEIGADNAHSEVIHKEDDAGGSSTESRSPLPDPLTTWQDRQ
ncbi:MAG: ATP-binding protein [Micromonosporaceae bacterium]